MRFSIYRGEGLWRPAPPLKTPQSIKTYHRNTSKSTKSIKLNKLNSSTTGLQVCRDFKDCEALTLKTPKPIQINNLYHSLYYASDSIKIVKPHRIHSKAISPYPLLPILFYFKTS